MRKLLTGLSLAAFIVGLQVGVVRPASAVAPLSTTTPENCAKSDWCTTPIPDVQNWECVAGTKACSTYTTSQGCQRCNASSLPPLPH